MSQASCFHGGAFWAAIGADYHDLSARHRVVNADVLDAWFPPAPSVVETVQETLEWLTRTSPPTHAEGLVKRLAEVNGVCPSQVLVGAGSSALIYLMFREWVSAGATVLVLDPMYGEYDHLARRANANVVRLKLSAPTFTLNLHEWVSELRRLRPNVAVIVNPNNPTGHGIPGAELRAALEAVPSETRVVVDEAYAPYVPGTALDLSEPLPRNVFVLRSMSKSHALSGLRVAYLVGESSEVDRLNLWTPPWAVSLVAQVAAIRALESETYYAARRAETDDLRQVFSRALTTLGLQDVVGTANWLLARIPEGQGTAESWVRAAAKEGVFLRDAGRTSTVLGERYLRVAVRSADENHRVREVLAQI